MKTGGRTVPVRLDLPEGSIETEITLPAAEERLVVLAFQLLPLSGEVADMAAQAAGKAGFPISCKKGCGVCCRQLVPLSPPEAAMIFEFIETMSEPRKSTIRKRFDRQLTKLKDSKFLTRLERLRDPEVSDNEYNGITQAYFDLDVSCPFLEDECCSIYPLRPSMCREYLVTSPSESCADPVTRPVRRVPVSIRLSEALARTWASLSGELVQVIPLILAPTWVHENPQVRGIRGDAVSLLRSVLSDLREAGQRSQPRTDAPQG